MAPWMSPVAAVLEVASVAVILKERVVPGLTVTGVVKLNALLAFAGDTVALLPDALTVNEASIAGLLTVTATVPICCDPGLLPPRCSSMAERNARVRHRCNCTTCRRFGALWAYKLEGDGGIEVSGPTQTYTMGGFVAFHFCPTCSYVAHSRYSLNRQASR